MVLLQQHSLLHYCKYKMWFYDICKSLHSVLITFWFKWDMDSYLCEARVVENRLLDADWLCPPIFSPLWCLVLTSLNVAQLKDCRLAHHFAFFFCQFQNKIIFSKVQFYSFMGENPLLQVAKWKRNVKEAVVPGLGFYEISQHYIKQHCQSKCKISLKLFQIIYTLAAFCYLAMLLWPRRSMRRWVLVTKLLWAWARWGVAASELRAKKRANDMKNKVRCSYIRRKTWQVRGDIFVRRWGTQPVFCCMCFMIANVNKARTSRTDWGSLWCYFLTFLAESGGYTCFNTHWTTLSLD